MPTAMKKSPSSSPLNGSMSASSSCRNSESASSTPARNAPSAIDSPIFSISSAVPITSSSAAAVKTSRLPWLAMNLSAGRTTNRLATMTTAITATPLAAEVQWAAGCPASLPSSGRSASSGITARSWNSSTAKDSRPWRVASCRRSASEDSTSAVEDIAQARPATSAACHERPSTQAQAASTTPVIADLRAAQAENGPAQRPQPRGLELEPDQEQEQHHAELRDMQGGLDIADHGKPRRSDQHPRGEIAQHRAQLEALEERHQQHGGEEKNRCLVE